MTLLNLCVLARRKVLFVLCAVGALQYGAALPAAGLLPLPLDETIERALDGAPQLAASRAAIEAASQSAISAGQLPDPELIVGVDNVPVTALDRFSLGRDFMTMRKVGVMQAVPNQARRQLLTEEAQQQVTLADARLRAERFDIAIDAAQAWIDQAVVAQSLQRLRALRADLALQTEVAGIAFANGRGSAAEALAAESVLAGLDARILEFEQRGALSRTALARWIGEAADRPPADLPWRMRTQQRAADTRDSLRAAPLASVEPQLALARTGVALARAAKHPDWSVEFSYLNRAAGNPDMVSLQFRIGLPLFARDRQDPQIAARLAEVRAQEATREQAIRAYRAQVDSAVTVLQSGSTRLEHFESVLLPLARDRARAAGAAYGGGRGELREVLDALVAQADLDLAFTQLAGEVTRAGVFLQLAAWSGETP